MERKRAASRLTVSGGTISATGEEGYGIENAGTLTLHALDVFGNNGADIWLGTGKKIGFGSGTYSIPEKKIKVVCYGDNALPYTFTSGYGTYVKSGNDIIDPADVFDNSDTIILFGGEAQLMDANAIYVKYIDANGKLHDDLDGSTETTDDDGAAALPITSSNNDVTYDGGWYYANGNVTIDGTLEFTGDAHIILCDGVKMTATTNTDADAISATNLNIYGQSNSTGTLTVNSDITAKSISAPGVTVIAKDKDATKNITANGDVTAGSVIATSLTATGHNLTLTGTGSEIGTTSLGDVGKLTVNDNAGGSVGKLTAGTVNVNKGGALTATSVTGLSSLTVTGGTLSLSEASNLTAAAVTLADGGVIRTNGGALTVGNVSGAGTIQGKAGVVLMSNINNPNLNIVAETKNITATDDGFTTIIAKSLTATDGNIVANGKDITAETISVSGVTAQDITAGTISTKGTVTARNIKAGSGGVTISGGQVTVEGISASNGNIILGWKASEDFIQANSYSGTVKIADGQYFTYQGNTGSPFSGTLSAEQVTAIAGKKLTPTSKPYGTITVSAKGWSGEYDGKGHSITVTVKKPSGATVKYRTGTSGTYSKTNPSFTDVGTYTVYYKVTKANYTTVTGNKKVTITAADVKYDGGTITQDENGYHVSYSETPETKDGSEGSTSADPLPISGHVDDLDYSRKLGAPKADDGGEGQGEVKGDVTIGGKEANLFTVCLPFALPTGKDKSDDVTYYTLSSVTGTTLDFTAVEDKDIAAFTPYLIAVTGDSGFTLSCTDESFDTDEKILTTTVQTEAGDFTFTGTLTGLSNADAVKAAGEGNVTYILQKGSQWGKVKDDTEEHRKAYIPPFRAFVTGPDVVVAEARTLVSSFGETVGIDRIRTTDSDGTERWYDLNGRRIEKPHRKGLYIRNGKVTTTN